MSDGSGPDDRNTNHTLIPRIMGLLMLQLNEKWKVTKDPDLSSGYLRGFLH